MRIKIMEPEAKRQAHNLKDISKIKWYQAVDLMTRRELRILSSAGQLEWWQTKYIINKFKSYKSLKSFHC